MSDQPIQPLQLTPLDRVQASDMFLCVRAEGEDDEGKPVYCYFGIHLDNFEKMMRQLSQTRHINPRDFNAGVLCWGRDSTLPSAEMETFMREKFSFHDDCVILEVAE